MASNFYLERPMAVGFNPTAEECQTLGRVIYISILFDFTRC